MTSVAQAVLKLRPEFATRADLIAALSELQHDTYFQTIPQDIVDIIRSLVPELRQTWDAQISQYTQDLDAFLEKYESEILTGNIPVLDRDKLFSDFPACASIPDQSRMMIKMLGNKIVPIPFSAKRYIGRGIGAADSHQVYSCGDDAIQEINLSINLRSELFDDDNNLTRVTAILPCGLLYVYDYLQWHACIVDVVSKKSIIVTQLDQFLTHIDIYEYVLNDFGKCTQVKHNVSRFSTLGPDFLTIVTI